MSAPAPTQTVAARYNGPARSGNGGYVAGLVAHLLAPPTADGWAARTVVLRQPPPLDVAMPLTHDGTALTIANDAGPVAVARPAEAEPVPVAPVDAATARAAQASYLGLRHHPFPTCFACGTARAPGDGLRVFPGEVDPETGPDGEPARRLAATWTPDPSVADGPRATVPATWAALDCIGGWSGDLAERHLVLGTMTARVHRLPAVGEEHVVVGAMRGSRGRRTLTAASLYDSAGRLVATAEHVWIAVDPADFN